MEFPSPYRSNTTNTQAAQPTAEDEINWGQVMKFQTELQKNRENHERAIKREQQTLYRDEIGRMLDYGQQKKLIEKQHDEGVRRQIEQSNLDIEEKEKQSRLIRKGMHQDFISQGLDMKKHKDAYARFSKEKEKETEIDHLKMQEERFQVKSMIELENKKAMTEVLTDAYSRQKQELMERKVREKMDGMKYLNEFDKSTFIAQDHHRKQLFDKIREGYTVNNQVWNTHLQGLDARNQTAETFEKNFIERAGAEKMMREEQRMKMVTETKKQVEKKFFTENLQLTEKKHYDKNYQKIQEISKANEALHRRLEEDNKQERQFREYKSKLYEENRKSLDAQLQSRKQNGANYEKLSGVESSLNKHAINIIQNTSNQQLNELLYKPSLPGMNVNHERKLQNDYLTKSLVGRKGGSSVFDNNAKEILSKPTSLVFDNSTAPTANESINQSMAKKPNGKQAPSYDGASAVQGQYYNGNGKRTGNHSVIPSSKSNVTLTERDDEATRHYIHQSPKFDNPQTYRKSEQSNYFIPPKYEYQKIKNLNQGRSYNIINYQNFQA
jgi:hypothetical protein